MYIDHDVKQYVNSFADFMALSGECVRHQKGRKTQRIVLGDKTYFIKQHHGVGWKEIFKNLLQGRWPVLGATQEMLAIEKLQSLGIRVPGIAAFGAAGFNPARRKSFILMPELKPVISLEDLCKVWKKIPPAFAFKFKLIQEVAGIARTLHQGGVNHRDFYICHFLLHLDPDWPTNPCLSLIDLHRAQIHSEVPQRWIIKDLSGLYFSSKDIGLTKRDLLRFIRFYSNQSLRETIKMRDAFWQKVRNRGERLYRDHIRN